MVRSASRCCCGRVREPVGGRAAHEAADRPAAVASGRAEPRDLALEHHDPELRPQRLQVVGAPEAGEAGADDRDVALQLAGEGLPRLERLCELPEPEAARTVSALARGVERHGLRLPHARRSGGRLSRYGRR